MPTHPGDPHQALEQHIERLPNGCWIWTGRLYKSGYGKFSLRPYPAAHLAAYRLLVGPIPEGKQIHHRCLNKLCCNPDHMVPLDYPTHRAIHAALITHCKYGHPLSGTNLRVTKRGQRQCVQCIKRRSSEWQKANRERNAEKTRRYRARKRAASQ